jgi:hypothetical protein
MDSSEVPREPAQGLDQALKTMRWRVEPGRFSLLGFAEPAVAADLTGLARPAQLILEEGETTLLVPSAQAAEVLARHPGAQVEQGLVWIRFEAAMGWEVVGFLALVSGRLAAAGIPIGAVCSYSRDHLFVAEAHLEAARAVLTELFPEEH